MLNKEIIDRNQQAVTEKFSLTSYADRTLKIYQELLDTEDTSGCQFANGQILLDQYLSPTRFNLLPNKLEKDKRRIPFTLRNRALLQRDAFP